MSEILLVDLKRNDKALEKEIKQALDNTIQSANFILCPKTEKFEKNFAHFCGTGAVVTKDVPSNTTVAGNPARIIK